MKRVRVAGVCVSYGLYFEAVDHNAGFLLSIEWELKADPGNLNGPVVLDNSQHPWAWLCSTCSELARLLIQAARKW